MWWKQVPWLPSDFVQSRRSRAGGIGRIYLDMDGVVADFYSYARVILGADYRTIHPEVAWDVLGQVPNLYRRIPPLAGAREFYARLCEIAPVALLSSVPLPTHFLIQAPVDKRAWVWEHLSAEAQVITVCGWEQKNLFVAPDIVLIDDSARNINRWRQSGGIGIEHRSIADSTRELLDALSQHDSGRYSASLS